MQFLLNLGVKFIKRQDLRLTTWDLQSNELVPLIKLMDSTIKWLAVEFVF